MFFICGSTSRVKHTPAGRECSSDYCDRWSCGTCFRKRLKRLSEELAGGDPNIFITITWAVGRGIERIPAALLQRQAWAKFVALYNREHGACALQYMAVCEATQEDWPHMHILVRAKWVSQKKLSAFMKKEIGAEIVDVQSLKQIRSVAKYLAKYLAKGPAQYGTLKRYWRSLGYLLPEFLEERRGRRRPGQWGRDPRSWQAIAFDAALRGFRVDAFPSGCFIHARAPP